MAHLAWHDPLTGLPTARCSWIGSSTRWRCRRAAADQLAVLFCDLDGFKRVNDLFGHAAGDELLVEVGRRIRAAVRDDDTVARLGGDEFAVLLEEVDDPDELGASCERILDALRRRIQVSGEDVSVTTTIGVAMSEPGDSADALLSQADLAMYHAKSQGKNRYETYRLSFGDERLQRIELVETLRRAIETKDLEVVYQPVVDLQHASDPRRRGAGALAARRRARAAGPLHPDRRGERPDRRPRRDRARHRVRATRRDCARPPARTHLDRRQRLGRSSCSSTTSSSRSTRAQAAMGDVHLILEVTERDFVNNDRADPRRHDRRSPTADVRFAIDDFGVGFSSMSYLQRLPVRILKVDRSFLGNIEDDPNGLRPGPLDGGAGRGARPRRRHRGHRARRAAPATSSSTPAAPSRRATCSGTPLPIDETVKVLATGCRVPIGTAPAGAMSRSLRSPTEPQHGGGFCSPCVRCPHALSQAVGDLAHHGPACACVLSGFLVWSRQARWLVSPGPTKEEHERCTPSPTPRRS